MCRLERSRQWAVRCIHESKLYDHNHFVTLTYDDCSLPASQSLQYSDYAAFMKRLRKYWSSRRPGGVSTSNPIRFYMCGEYGGATSRPHYHALLFNVEFPDKLYFKRVGSAKLYTSALLSKLWPLGNHLIGALTFESAAYVARYCMDKITGDAAEAHYRFVDQETGEIFQRVPEFNQASRRPGIGAPFLAKFRSDVYPRGKVVINAREAKAPRYYDKLFKRDALQSEIDELAYNRFLSACDVPASEGSDARLAVREQVALARLNLRSRSL